MKIIDVVMKLIGPIEPLGETNADKKRLENLIEMLDIVDQLLGKIKDVATYKDRVEYSMKIARNYLRLLGEELEGYTGRE